MSSRTARVFGFAWVMAIILVALPALGDGVRTDGNWWLASSTAGLTKVTYMLGFLHGTNVGLYVAGLDGTADHAFIDKSVHDLDAKLRNVTAGQLVDGVDKFYADYRNRSVLVHDAVLVVLRSIWGYPNDKIEALTIVMRKNAADNAAK